MKVYQVAVMENSEGNRQYLMTFSESIFNAEKTKLEEQGYLMSDYIRTTDKALYCKMRCKIFVSELRELEEYRMNHMVELNKTCSETDSQVRETEKMYEELEEMYIDKVARAYSRYLRADMDSSHDYTDELAVQCYNYRESKMRLQNQLALENYMKAPYDC